jgi:hypothetical protein
MRASPTGRHYKVGPADLVVRQQRQPDPRVVGPTPAGEEDTWIRRYHEAFAQAGGVATFHLFPAFDADGHRLVDRPKIWEAAVDDFLRALNFPAR